MKGQSHLFRGVDVGLPSKVQGSEAEEEWQEVDWVTWSTGELSVDSDAFVLVFKPSAGGNVKAKPLGVLLRANPVEHSEDGRTLMVTTNDAVSKLYRLTFNSQADAVAFTKLAQQAEETCAAGEEDAACEAMKQEEMAKLEADIQEAHAAPAAKGPQGPPPLLFVGAELCGPDPGHPAGGEVLLGEGVVALLDPPDDGKVGNWQLLLYTAEDGARKPTSRFTIGPATRLRRQKPQSDPSGPAASFTLSFGVPGTAAEKAHTISFNDDKVAELFARDFRVRQRLMELSLKHVKGQQSAQELLGEIRDLKSKTICARLMNLLFWLLLLSLLAAGGRVGMMYKEDQGTRKPAEYVKALVKDAQRVAQVSQRHVASAGSKACQVAFQVVPAADLQSCLGAPSSSLRNCVERLASAPP